MNALLYKEWLRKLDDKMKLANRRILLLVDNCPSHIDIQLETVKIKFLPPNMTGILQPLDLGIIRSFKCNFRKLQIHKIIAKVDSCSSVLQPTNHLH